MTNELAQLLLNAAEQLEGYEDRSGVGMHDNTYATELKAAAAALKEKATRAVPEGWKLVPVEPTHEMLAATSWPGCAATDYKHMLAAAPQPAPTIAVPKGQTVPQTVENLQAIMARDAETMLEMRDEIGRLKSKINQLQQRPASAVPVWKQLLDRVVPRIDAGGPNPLDQSEHCCEWTLYCERERIHNEFADIAASQQQGGGE